MNLISIDPGQSGGIAWTDGTQIACLPMPDTEGAVVDQLRSIAVTGATAYVEEVGGWGMPGPRGFTFGRGFGFLLGVLQTLSVPVVLVRPVKWQKHFSLGSVKLSGGKTAWKRKLLSESQRRFPTLDVTLKTADALLILDYARADFNSRQA